MGAASADLIHLVLGIFGVLIVASVIGYVLERRLSPDGSNAAIENLNARIKAWWVMVVLIGIAFIAGRAGVILLFAFCSFAALREFMTLINTKRADHWALAAAFFVALPVQYYLLWAEQYGIYSIFIPVYAFLFMPIIAVLRGDTERFLVRIAEVQWALMICVFCASHVPALLTLHIPGYEGRNVLLIAFLVIVVQLSDVLQYVWGKLFGKTKIAPRFRHATQPQDLSARHFVRIRAEEGVLLDRVPGLERDFDRAELAHVATIEPLSPAATICCAAIKAPIRLVPLEPPTCRPKRCAK